MISIFIIDPATGRPVSVKEWEKAADPTTAKAVLITNESGQTFVLDKEDSKKDMNFDTALDWAQERGGTTGTRKQWIDVYEAIHTAGLNDALKLIGGDPIRRSWYWTREKDCDQSHANRAWFFYGYFGSLSCSSRRISAFAARVFRAFQP